jgi:hypothetical protein
MTTRSSHPAEFDVTVGDDVYSRDGERLGAVKEVTAGHFKVDAPRAGDYWLDRATVSTPDGGPPGRLYLTFDREQIDDFKLDGPFAHAESPILDAEAETYTSSGEVDRRRAEQSGGTAP